MLATQEEKKLNAYFAQAITHHQAEEWQQAESLYRKVLDAIPEQPNANYNLGMLKMQLNQANESLDFFKRALTADSGETKYWIAYVEALIAADQKKRAVDVLKLGVENGLHGEEVNALVEQISKISMPTAMKPVINYGSQAKVQMPSAGNMSAVIKPEQKTAPVNTASIKTASANVAPKKTAPKKTAHQYQDNPQIQKVLKLQQSGKLAQAKKQWMQLLKFYPKHPTILTGLGMIAIEQGDLEEGVKQLKQSLESVPNQTTALSYLSIAYYQLNKLADALRCAEEAIALNDHYAEAHANRGNVLRALKRYDDAIASYQRANTLQPNDAVTLFNLASMHVALKQYQTAVDYLHTVIELAPKQVEYQHLYAEVLLELKQYEAALKQFSAAATLAKDNADILFGRGAVYLELKQYQKAVTDFEHVLRLNPSYKDAALNLGVAHKYLGHAEEALKAYDQVIKQNPNHIHAYNNKGLLLVQIQRFDEALACYEQVLKLEPNLAETKWNKALLHLLLGDYVQGWKLYESRWQSILKAEYRHFTKPLWLGDEPIAGKKILIYPEQGLGDYIQFCRYATLLEAEGAQVILEVPAPLLSVMKTLKGNFELVESGQTLPDHDLHCPMMSLPLALKTSVETIPADTPYLFVDQNKQQHWQKRLDHQKDFKVGLVWSGAAGHQNDQHRSIALQTLTPLLSQPVQFYALQTEIRERDLEAVAQAHALHTYQDEIQDFSDTAALIANMDLVITVDTSVAHMAGAMNKPCWLMLPYAPDFRWMLNTTESPWYPSMKLFRQPDFNDWESVIRMVCLQLQNELALK